ncbi:MAG: 50S ribosomal protein L25 [Bacteroidia bacterium]|nr:50S ribosomal protein L25 [Bacteroidia bacterium]MCX7764275.1 50S ribosomal protein L25 [Bacteroidia bacterium]MDW8058123.1 50S ribosomal protein L25 [Bacteroidia bacterium]
MQVYRLSGEPRVAKGSSEARRLRRAGKVPCALYGKGVQENFLLSQSEAHKIVFTPHVYLFEIGLNGQTYTAVLREYQLHPVHDYVMHLDFMACGPEDEITVALPVKLVGIAEGVQMGGKLVPLTRRLRVKGKVKDLPAVLEIDISSLKLGKTLTAGKISFPGLQVLSSPDTAIARIEVPRALRTQQS